VTAPDLVYHFTDTARLPWILISRELRPGRNKIGGMPDPDFLWATTDSRGDRTASSSHQSEMYRKGRARMVRFTLRAHDFEPWRKLVDRHPAWTSVFIDRLVRAARAVRSSPDTWLRRTEPLPWRNWISVETRSPYGDNIWLPFEGPFDGPVIVDCGDGYMGVKIKGKVFASRPHSLPNGNRAYEIWRGADDIGVVLSSLG
jgi:hypothetical protein